MTKKHICVDFDGVIHSYISGWQGIAVIQDKPVHGALPWLRNIQSHPEYQVCIYSSRSKDEKGLAAMKDWMVKHGLSNKEVRAFHWPTQKPAAWLTLDDRAICFRGTFPSILEMDSFQLWTNGYNQNLDKLSLEELHDVVDLEPGGEKQDWDHLTWDDCAIEFEQTYETEGYNVKVMDNDGDVVRCWVYLMEWSGSITSAINHKNVPGLVRALVECNRIEARPGFYLREEQDNE